MYQHFYGYFVDLFCHSLFSDICKVCTKWCIVMNCFTCVFGNCGIYLWIKIYWRIEWNFLFPFEVDLCFLIVISNFYNILCTHCAWNMDVWNSFWWIQIILSLISMCMWLNYRCHRILNVKIDIRFNMWIDYLMIM